MRKFILFFWIASFSVAAFAADASRQLAFAVDKKPALTMQLLPGWTAKNSADKIDLKPEKFEVHIQLWNVAKANSVAAAVAMVPEFIKSEVTEFKAVSTKDIKVAGGGAKHLIGTGSEADDSDPSNAEVFLFSVGGKVFMICAHGEGEGAAKARASILQMLATAKKP